MGNSSGDESGSDSVKYWEIIAGKLSAAGWSWGYCSAVTRNGWQCFEAPGVQPYWTGEDAKQSAIDYAKARAKFGRGEIRVLSKDGHVEDVISLQGGSTVLLPFRAS